MQSCHWIETIEFKVEEISYLALVLNKIQSGAKAYYEGVTVLPVEWAHMNSRLIVRPDEEWAKIVDEINSVSEEDSISDLRYLLFQMLLTKLNRYVNVRKVSN